MAGDVEVEKGLAGVVADETAISEVMTETDSLTYRGYDVEELAERCSFEEVACLLLEGELPDTDELEGFRSRERAARALPAELADVLGRLPSDAHPMDLLRTAVSALGAEGERGVERPVAGSGADEAVTVFARMPTIVAAVSRRREGSEPVDPRDDLGYAENFLWMCFEEVPSEEVVGAFDASLTLYADHGFNASTFAARLVTSTESDLYSAIVAAIGALKGPLHGGANEAVVHMLEEIADPGNAEQWVSDALAQNRKIMGFGHRVYQEGDSRVPTMRRGLGAIASACGEEHWLELADAVERAMQDAKGIFPNVDFPAGPAYRAMGLQTELFTPIFAMARTAGWIAHVREQAADNALVRPMASYVGPEQREVPRVEDRG